MLLLCLCTLALGPAPDASALAKDYAAAVRELNDAHAAKPVVKSEEELARRLPAAAEKALAALVKSKDAPELAAALVVAGEAALDLDRMDDFELVRARLAQVAPGEAKQLGIALSRPRFVARGTDGVEQEGLAAIADAFDVVLDGYRDVFGITNFSKVPGKKLRLRAHLVDAITRPPHFAPEFPWHSEIDFPVIEAKTFTSPTPKGQFLFYGLCHELGHVVAMWGDTRNEEDRHAWAHYTGVVLVEELTKAKGEAVKGLRDARWRSLTKAREELAQPPDEEGKERHRVMKLLVTLHDLVGPKTIGSALNALDDAGKHLRVNRVRYYSLADFEKALCATDTGKKKAKEIAAAFAAR
ncbi:MAG: hypothetical protein HZA53_11730 [Planctomycetes bacterium]|nr:hypothetical protein [Planctomycetota bacterium]